VEKRCGLLKFFALVFKEFQVVIWFCMLLKDIHELLPLFMPKQFICKFTFVWGRNKCSQTLGRITPTLTIILRICTLSILSFSQGSSSYKGPFIDDRPNKAIWNPWYNCVFLELLRGQLLSRCNIQYKSWAFTFVYGLS